MTALVGIKRRGRIAIVTDGVSLINGYKERIVDENLYKVVEVNGSEGCFIAATGSVPASILLKNEKNLFDGKKDITFNYCVRKLVPRMFAIMEREGRLVDDGTSFDLSLIIMTPTRLFSISKRGVVLEHDSVTISGCGEYCLFAYYDMLKDKIDDPLELGIECMKESIASYRTLDYPIFAVTNDGKRLVIEKEDQKG